MQARSGTRPIVSRITDWVIHDGRIVPLLPKGPSTTFGITYDSERDLAILRKRIDQYLGEPLQVRLDGDTACMYDDGGTWVHVVPEKGTYPVYRSTTDTIYFTPRDSMHMYRAWRCDVKEIHWDGET